MIFDPNISKQQCNISRCENCVFQNDWYETVVQHKIVDMLIQITKNIVISEFCCMRMEMLIPIPILLETEIIV